MRLFLASSLLRSTPVVASAVLHVGIAAVGFAVGGGGHGQAPVVAPEVTIAIEAAPEPPPPVPEPAPSPAVAPPPKAEEPPPEARPVAAEPPAHHTHDYPVAADHDAVPHDPSVVHDHPHDHEPAAAAPAVTSDADLPRFDLSSGKATTTSARVVSASGAGAGASPSSASAPAIEPVLPESAVSVPATLVARAVAAYPAAARAGELEADVPFEIVVDGSGAVVDARPLPPRAGSGFDESALAAIRRYRFSPAQRDGHPVRVRMRWTVQFRLR